MQINKETILSYFLGFVVIWFGVNEIMEPERWAGYVPEFIKEAIASAKMVNYMVLGHGVVLSASGLALVLGFRRRAAAFIIFLMLLGIVAALLQVSGLDEIAVRDIGLLGMALALTLKN